jgi:GNAT superfamily N-acetyltransferase
VDSARPAEPFDLPTIVELANEVVAELTPMRGGPIWAQHEARPTVDESAYRDLLDRADAHVVVGAVDDAVIGFGVAVLESLHDGRRLGVVPELFVAEGARAVGVGEQMLLLLVEWCEAQGCVGVDTLALPGHRAAKNFFEQSGFTARAIVMHKDLRR